MSENLFVSSNSDLLTTTHSYLNALSRGLPFTLCYSLPDGPMIASISPGLASPLTCFSISRLSIRTHISLKTSSCPLVWCLSCASLCYERWKRKINKTIHRSMTKSILYECKVISGVLACNPGCPPIGQACKIFPQWNALNYTVKIC